MIDVNDGQGGYFIRMGDTGGNIDLIPSDGLTLAGFLLIVVAVPVLALRGAGRVDRTLARRFAGFLILWIGGLAAVVQSGVLQRSILPGVPLFFATINLGALAFGLSPWGRQLAGLPLRALVAFQGFRFPLELVLHRWAELGTVPPTMTWTGQNLDVVSGLLALGALFGPGRSRAYAWAFNVAGSLLLLNVLRVVVLSSPLPFSWPLARPLALAFHLPYALIAIVCVWAAIAGHVILTRALLRGEET
jgi:hypothetical protein